MGGRQQTTHRFADAGNEGADAANRRSDARVTRTRRDITRSRAIATVKESVPMPWTSFGTRRSPHSGGRMPAVTTHILVANTANQGAESWN
jgi:hypothetical protein